MKITLISPYEDIACLGLRSISAYLKRAGYQTQMIFLPRVGTEGIRYQGFQYRYDERLLRQVVALAMDSDLIGISLMTNYFDNAVQLTRKLKQELDAPIIWGGIHPTVRPEECLDYADMVCLGEGEEAMFELVTKMQAGQCYEDVRNVWLRINNRVVKNELRPLLQDLDSLPYPDYDLEGHYVLYKRNESRAMTYSLLSQYLDNTYTTMLSRGCPWQCTYCCNNAVKILYRHQKILRRRSVEHFIGELAQVKARMPFIEAVKIEDDNFFSSSLGLINDFCQAYTQRVKLPLIITGGHPAVITEEKMEVLVDAGLMEMRMGIQTGSNRTKKLYHRFVKNETVLRSAQVLNKFDGKICPPQYDFILDNPWGTEEDLLETLNLLLEIPKPYRLNLFSLTFFPGTELYDKAKTEGLIRDDLNEVYRKYYFTCRRTYLNGLFFLFNSQKIPKGIMRILLSRQMVKLEWHWLPYLILEILFAAHMLTEGVKALFNADFPKIYRAIRYRLALGLVRRYSSR